MTLGWQHLVAQRNESINEPTFGLGQPVAVPGFDVARPADKDVEFFAGQFDGHNLEV